MWLLGISSYSTSSTPPPSLLQKVRRVPEDAQQPTDGGVPIWAGDTYRIYSRVCGRNLLDISQRMASAEGETLEATFRDYVQSARV